MIRIIWYVMQRDKYYDKIISTENSLLLILLYKTKCD